ncbi:NAD-dependent epimerase/dehydratase family protein [Paraglaciecola sp.]|uniref:NAD-dependent epimerase/dehydratase family protein n=1 Tax=Paraglaciecola sp. TaxID=1920173 RepID=UPI00326478AF
MGISIVGCGWLGQPLALTLKGFGYNIVASTRSLQKCTTLNDLGLEAVKFELGDDLNIAAVSAIFTSNTLILNIPVGRKAVTPNSFIMQIHSLVEHASRTQIKQVIFISTTSVYGDQDQVITEHSPTMPVTSSGKTNLIIEALVTEAFPKCSTIIRLSGLVNHDRHPANYLAGKSNLPNPNGKTNLIHQDDVIRAIYLVITKNLWGHTLHLSALQHPTRKDYYTWSAAKLALPAPTFIACEQPAAGKEIDATYSLEKLGLTLKYPSPYDMIKA